MGGDFRRGNDGPRGKDDFDFRKSEYQDDGPRSRPPDDDGEGCGGQVLGWVVLIGIVGGVYLISKTFFGVGIILIPIPRR